MLAMKTKTKRRSGSTLIEIILVMTILVIISAMSIPSLQSMYGSYKLNGGVDAVRSAWADARARAIEEGRPYRFSVEQDGSSYRVAPNQDDYWVGGNNGPDDDPNGKGLILEKSLPSGVRFAVNGEPSNPSTVEEPTKDTLEEKPVTTSNWTTAVIFEPDGTSKHDVGVQFSVRGCKATTLQLRGMTGTVSVKTEK
jgi:type II secretory pathway pseudopilin PulG